MNRLFLVAAMLAAFAMGAQAQLMITGLGNSSGAAGGSCAGVLILNGCAQPALLGIP